MINKKRILAIIPARGGSKRLPGKNIKELAGKPLVQHTIDAAEQSSYIDEIIFTSDREDILDTVNVNKTILQKRDPHLALDETKSIDVIFDSYSFFQSLDKSSIDYILVLQPTSPLRNRVHIDKSIELLENMKADGIISVCECEHSPLWANTLPADNAMGNFLPESLHNSRSQDLAPYYRLNGAIYICDVKRLYSEKTFMIKDNIYAYIMEQCDSVDIDNIIDFKLAEVLLGEKYE